MPVGTELRKFRFLNSESAGLRSRPKLTSFAGWHSGAAPFAPSPTGLLGQHQSFSGSPSGAGRALSFLTNSSTNRKE
jgi:hypothetical protein